MSIKAFQISDINLETGMRGYPVGYCKTSFVDPQDGLHYKGIPIRELTNKSSEEAIYLLMHGSLPTKEEAKAFSKELEKRATLDPKVIETIRTLPKNANPMELFSSAILILGMIEGTQDYHEDALNIIAKIPLLAAEVINYHSGWGCSNESRPELGYMENFVHILNIPNKNAPPLTKTLKLFNVLHLDHGGGNLSTFVGKAVSSSLEDMYGSLSSSMNALAGPRHGSANQKSLEFVKEVYKELRENFSGQEVENLVRKKLNNRELIFGFGHAVLRKEDPRATIFYNEAKELFPEHPIIKTAFLLREHGTKALKEKPKIQNPYPNVDAISGPLLLAAGFDKPQYFTVLFGMARCVGIALQIEHERCKARNGLGIPIYRPKYIYNPD